MDSYDDLYGLVCQFQCCLPENPQWLTFSHAALACFVARMIAPHSGQTRLVPGQPSRAIPEALRRCSG